MSMWCQYENDMLHVSRHRELTPVLASLALIPIAADIRDPGCIRGQVLAHAGLGKMHQGARAGSASRHVRLELIRPAARSAMVS